MAESPKHFFKKVLQRGPYYEVLTLMDQNPNWTVHGSVDSDRGHYVHYNSTDVRLEVDGWLGDDYGPTPETDAAETAAGQAVDRLQEALQEQCRDWNRQLEKDLYAELESQQSDEVLTQWMDDNDWRFDEDGNQVDMAHYLPIDQLKPGIQQKVLQQYADLFDRTPEQVMQALITRKVLFDKRGNSVDVSGWKMASDLDETTRSRILDKYRNILTEDNMWAEIIEEDWKEKLGAFGFDRIEIRYSLGYSQGDGASFTAGSIDVHKLCEAMLQQERTQAEARDMVANLIG